MSASIEMMRTGGTQVTAYRNLKDVQKASYDPGSHLINSSSPMSRYLGPNCLLISKGHKSPKLVSDEGVDEDNDTPRQMKLGVFQSKNSSIVYDAESEKIINSSQVF